MNNKTDELKCYFCGKILSKKEIDDHIQKEVIPELRFRNLDISNNYDLQNLITLTKKDMRNGIKDIYCTKC